MAVFVAAITFILLLITTLCLVSLRLRAILDPNRPKAVRDSGNGRNHLLIVLGSGGHSAEMLSMLERAVSEKDPHERLDWRDFNFRTWVVSSGDQISALRAKGFENMVRDMSTSANEGVEKDPEVNYSVVNVPRAREIHQSLLTAPLSCLRCLFACWTALLPSNGADFPDVILCNGPATATIVVFTSILMRFFDVQRCNSKGKMRTIYVESWARVKRLSLSGKLLLPVVDRFLVQWPQLLETTKGKGEFHGVLVS